MFHFIYDTYMWMDMYEVKILDGKPQKTIYYFYFEITIIKESAFTSLYKYISQSLLA